MKTPFHFIIILICFLFGLCLERVISLPFFSLTFLIFWLAALPTPWRNAVFLFAGVVLASIYQIPFWLSFLLVLIIRLPVDILVIDRRYEDVITLLSIFGCLLAIGWWTHFPLVLNNLFLMGIESAILVLMIIFLVHRHAR